MTAETFLDESKRRILRISFPDFDICDDYSGLLDIGFYEVMSDSPDIEIGNLVIPELTVTVENVSMKNHMNETIRFETGIETDNQDITGEVLKIQEKFGDNLILVLSITGRYLVAKEKNLHCVYFDETGALHLSDSFHCAQNITSIYYMEESAESGGHLYSAGGKLYLVHDNVPYMTYVVWYSGSYGGSFSGEEQRVTVTEGLHESVLKDMGKQHTSITCTNRGTAQKPEIEIRKPDLRFVRYYNQQKELCRKVISAKRYAFSMASYGEYIITETTSHDEETTEILCYGILNRLAGKSAEGFFTIQNFTGVRTFSDLYTKFISWLNEENILITAKNQNFLNLDSIPVTEPDWTAADFGGVTADMILREFAMLEGGNARINHENQLELGWCSTEPVLTTSTDSLSSLHVGTERLTPARGFKFLNADTGNVIRTELEYDNLVLLSLCGESVYTEAFQRITENFSANQHQPFSADMLTGASPFLRAGDSLRLISQSGAAVTVPVFLQQIMHFPFPESQIFVPENTDWSTVPVDFTELTVISINVENWPEFLVYGMFPDCSDIIVTAVQKNLETFQVSTALCHFAVSPEITPTGLSPMTCEFEGILRSTLIPVMYALLMEKEQPLLTASGAVLAVKSEKAELTPVPVQDYALLTNSGLPLMTVSESV